MSEALTRSVYGAILKRMESFICKACGGTSVRRSASFPIHLFRKAINSNKRRCLDCKYKWREPGQRRSPAAVIVLLGVFGLALAALSRWREKNAAHEFMIRSGSELNAGLNFKNPSLSEDDPEEDAERLSEQWRQEQSLEGGRPSPPDWGAPPAETWAAAQPSEKKGFLANLSLSSGIILKMLKGRSKKEIIQELDTSDKKTLWEKYGKYFGSKDEAKKTYEEYKKKRASGELSPDSEKPAP